MHSACIVQDIDDERILKTILSNVLPSLVPLPPPDQDHLSDLNIHFTFDSIFVVHSLRPLDLSYHDICTLFGKGSVPLSDCTSMPYELDLNLLSYQNPLSFNVRLIPDDEELIDDILESNTNFSELILTISSGKLICKKWLVLEVSALINRKTSLHRYMLLDVSTENYQILDTKVTKIR